MPCTTTSPRFFSALLCMLPPLTTTVSGNPALASSTATSCQAWAVLVNITGCHIPCWGSAAVPSLWAVLQCPFWWSRATPPVLAWCLICILPVVLCAVQVRGASATTTSTSACSLAVLVPCKMARPCTTGRTSVLHRCALALPSSTPTASAASSVTAASRYGAKTLLWLDGYPAVAVSLLRFPCYRVRLCMCSDTLVVATCCTSMHRGRGQQLAAAEL